MIEKIVSGGQTGSDRAGLDAAITLNIPHGGWCPKGRLAELGGTIPDKYQLQETNSSDFSERTKLNIRDSDGTLIFVPKLPLDVNDGTVLTIQEVKDKEKRYLIIDLSTTPHPQPIINEIIDWVKTNNIRILNIAGPRESLSPGTYQATYNFLIALLPKIIEKPINHIAMSRL